MKTVDVLKYSRTEDYAGFTMDEFEHPSGKAALPTTLDWATAHETVALFPAKWASEKNHLPMHKDAVAVIDAHLKTLP